MQVDTNYILENIHDNFEALHPERFFAQAAENGINLDDFFFKLSNDIARFYSNGFITFYTSIDVLNWMVMIIWHDSYPHQTDDEVEIPASVQVYFDFDEVEAMLTDDDAKNEALFSTLKKKLSNKLRDR